MRSLSKETLTKIDEFFSAAAELQGALESERDKMQEFFDDKSEKWQEEEKGQKYQSWIDAIEEKIGELEGIAADMQFPKNADEV